MRKQLLFLTLAAMLGPVASARSLSPSEALGRVPNQHVSRSGAAAPVLTVGSADAPALYVFNKAGGGYMIVSADDVAAPLIGYSNSGTFDPENMPENLRYWLEQYKEQITEASEAGAEAYAARTSRAASDRSPIAPLVKTKWNQDRPYWNDCPLSYGVNTYTGCVATAMAQIMKYHNWPKKANDNAKFSYQWAVTGETLTADFSNFEFDWANMLDEYGGTESYNATQANAVAKLMQACGYSLRMIYSPTASAAYSEQVGGALATYFGYDQGLHNEFRELHTSTEWEELIYNNLKDCGPMVYWGSGGGGAHCFVCDGYDTGGYFHFNWGWSGLSDGYFLLNALDPGSLGIGGGSGGGFSNAQGALLGIKPAGATESPRQYTFRINELSGADTGNSGGTYLYLRGEYTNLSPFVVNGAFKYRVYNYDGSSYLGSCNVYTPGCKNWGVDVATGNTVKAGTMMGGTSGIPSADGTYRVYPAVEIDGQEYMFQSPPTIAGYVLVTRQGGTITKVTIPSAGELQTLDLNTHGDYFVNAAFKFSGIAKFTGKGDTNQNVIPCLLNPDGSVRATGNWFTITFSTEGTPFEFVNETWFSDKGQTIAAGDYTFCLATTESGQYKPISGAVPVTVKGRVPSPTFKCTDLVVANADAVNPDDINITASFEGETGVTYRNIIFTIFKGMNSAWESQEILYVSAGQKASLPVKAALTGAQPGDRYYIYAAINNRGRYEYISEAVYFTIGDQSGIADIEADDNAPAEYFNLQGIRVSADKLAPGIYIKRQGSKTTKILVK